MPYLTRTTMVVHIYVLGTYSILYCCYLIVLPTCVENSAVTCAVSLVLLTVTWTKSRAGKWTETWTGIGTWTGIQTWMGHGQ